MFKKLIKNLSNLPGWSTKRQLVLIESDDWGSIRMPSLEVKDKMILKGVPMGNLERQRYTNFDTLAGKDDFEVLFESLSSVKDFKGNSPKLTAVSVVANPDFEKIKENNFKNFYYEPFTKTLERYGLDDSFDMWKLGIEKKLFIPQFHGREHLNVAIWLRNLQKGDRNTKIAFDYGCWGFANKNQYLIDYQAAFDLEFYNDIKSQSKIIYEGLILFEKIHGYKADFFVPPNGPFNNNLEEISANCGVKYISAAKIQKEPFGKGKYRTKFHWLGQINRFGQKYITRNCFFEPSDLSKDWVNSCLSDIEIAFRYNKPAIISSHRVNYIGTLNEKNRKSGNKQLVSLLKKIILKWPQVEFISSSELGDLI